MASEGLKQLFDVLEWAAQHGLIATHNDMGANSGAT